MKVLLPETTISNLSEGPNGAYFGFTSISSIDASNLESTYDVLINGITYRNVPTTFLSDYSIIVVGDLDDNDEPDLSNYPFSIGIDIEGNTVQLVVQENGSYTFSVFKQEQRIMTLSGASRTYSHTAEPRMVKSSQKVEKWPITTSLETIVDSSYSISSGSDIVLVQTTLSQDEFLECTVLANGEQLSKIHNEYFHGENIEIYLDSGYICAYSQTGGTFNIQITRTNKIIAEDFTEAVEIVSGGGSGLYTHHLTESNTPVNLLLICTQKESFTSDSLKQFLIDKGYSGQQSEIGIMNLYYPISGMVQYQSGYYTSVVGIAFNTKESTSFQLCISVELNNKTQLSYLRLNSNVQFSDIVNEVHDK